MKRRKHKPYEFLLHTHKVLREYDMSKNYLYEGWRIIPDHLLQLQNDYLRNPTRRKMNNVIKRDTMMYYGILEMIEARRKRVMNVKSELLFKKYFSDLIEKEVVDKHLGKVDLYKYTYNSKEGTHPLFTKRSYILHYQKEFIRTGKVPYITDLRRLDKELVSEINTFIKTKL